MHTKKTFVASPSVPLLLNPPAAAGVALRVLCIDDCENDVALLTAALRAGGYLPQYERVCTRADVIAALERQRWDIVISDYAMPQFNGLQALEVVAPRCPDVPFILVSGAIGEETAVTAMKSGAHDYVLKGDLARLVPAVRRGLAEADIRRARRLAESNLRSSEALLNSIVNTAADVIIVIDETGMIEFVNAAVERLFGWKPLELIGKNVDALILVSRRTQSEQAAAGNDPRPADHRPSRTARSRLLETRSSSTTDHAALFAWALGALDSTNLWDYVVDPFYWLFSLGWGLREWCKKREPARAESAG